MIPDVFPGRWQTAATIRPTGAGFDSTAGRMLCDDWSKLDLYSTSGILNQPSSNALRTAGSGTQDSSITFAEPVPGFGLTPGAYFYQPSVHWFYTDGSFLVINAGGTWCRSHRPAVTSSPSDVIYGHMRREFYFRNARELFYNFSVGSKSVEQPIVPGSTFTSGHPLLICAAADLRFYQSDGANAACYVRAVSLRSGEVYERWTIPGGTNLTGVNERVPNKYLSIMSGGARSDGSGQSTSFRSLSDWFGFQRVVNLDINKRKLLLKGLVDDAWKMGPAMQPAPKIVVPAVPIDPVRLVTQKPKQRTFKPPASMKGQLLAEWQTESANAIRFSGKSPAGYCPHTNSGGSNTLELIESSSFEGRRWTQRLFDAGSGTQLIRGPGVSTYRWEENATLSGYMWQVRNFKNGLNGGPALVKAGAVNRYLLLSMTANTGRKLSVNLNFWNSNHGFADITYPAGENNDLFLILCGFSAKRQPTGTTADVTGWQISKNLRTSQVRFKEASITASSWTEPVHEIGMVNHTNTSTNRQTKAQFGAAAFFEAPIDSSTIKDIWRRGAGEERKTFIPVEAPTVPDGEFSCSTSLTFNAAVALDDAAGSDLTLSTSLSFDATAEVGAYADLSLIAWIDFDAAVGLESFGDLDLSSDISFGTSVVLAAYGDLQLTTDIEFDTQLSLPLPGEIRCSTGLTFDASADLASYAALQLNTSIDFDASAVIVADTSLNLSTGLAFDSTLLLGGIFPIALSTGLEFDASIQIIDGNQLTPVPGIEFRIPGGRLHYRAPANKLHFRIKREP